MPSKRILSGKMKVEVTRPYVPLMTDLFIDAFAHPKKCLRAFSIDHYAPLLQFRGKWYFGPEGAGFGETVAAREEAEPGFIQKAFANIYSIGEELMESTERIQATNYSGVDPTILYTDFSDFVARYTTFAIALLGFEIQTPIERRIREFLIDRTDGDEELSILTFPRKKNYATLEKESLFRIGILAEENKDSLVSIETATPAVREAVKNHVEEYGWINARGGFGEAWTANEVIESVKKLGPDYRKKLELAERHIDEVEKKCQMLIESLGGSDEFKQLVGTAKELVYYRTYRTDYLNKVFYKARPLLEALANDQGIPLEHLLFMRIKEIMEKVQVSKEEIERRKTGYALGTVVEEETIFASDPKEIERILLEYCESETTSLRELKGTIANKGFARGNAKLLFGKGDLAKVEKGDVLVSPMTTPNMISAMGLAAGFVTDEGGITCHAAIISREMNKPCVIGTKFATQILKDGDLVEVDANRGVVRKL